MSTKKPNINEEALTYGYYSNLLQKPFDSVEELKEAEAAYYAELKAKEDKAAAKKADAIKVEDAFKALNQARRDYKENLLGLTSLYQKDLAKLKTDFENDRNRIQAALADAEDMYAKALKEFTDKYKEGYHLTLKDGDFETTISGQNKSYSTEKEDNPVASILNMLFSALN